MLGEEAQLQPASGMCLSHFSGYIWLSQEITVFYQGTRMISVFLAFRSLVWEFYGIL